MDEIDNKANYRSQALVAGYDTHRRIGEDDFVNDVEVGYFTAQVRQLAGPSGTVVDVGAGTGKLSLAMARLGYEVTAFDQSEAMLQRLRDKAAAEGLRIACRLVDIVADRPEEEPGSGFDVAISSRVLMHVADPEAMIARMAALSRRGIVFDAPRRLSPNRLLTMARALTGGEVYRCFDDGALVDTVTRQGLRTIDVSPLFVLPIGLHLKLRSQSLSRGLERMLGFARPFASSVFIAATRPSSP